MPDPMQNAPILPPAVRGEPVPYTVLLINPFYAKDIHASFGKHVLTPSLALTSLAGATPEPWKVRFWDENLLQGPPPADDVPQVVGITVHLTFAKRAYELAAWYRARGSIVVLGGLHALSCPDEVAEHCDALAIGNGVPIWPKILSDIEHGKLERRYHAEYRNYASDPSPDRSVLPRWGFLTPASLIATQGCHNRCDFCYLATGDTRIKYQMRTAQQVAAEFESTGAPYGVFVDNNLGSNRRYLRELCTALRPLRKIWSAAVTLDVSDDPSLVRDMALAGCTGVFIGFESLTDDNMRLAGKRSPRAEDYAARIQLFHANGIQVNGSFVLGFDQDRPEAFEKLANFIEEQRLECATFHILTPYPNTPLFARMERENRILHKDWSLYDTAHCVFRPKHMTPEQLEAGYEWIYQRLFSLRSIWARRPRQAPAVLPYLAMALLYKRSNWLWKFLIRHRLTHAVWAPLVHATRLRHLRYRKRLEKAPSVPGPLVWPVRPSV
ncbi:B12-binding domain-containing radical SAM protein [Pendulispora brunnea]|uniref:B12-binding domain-containing radical SAM protein n=1 Tax=Pendulispora brunnea TaxID=2905690 RepID=A0ABZ2KH14_9BACT